MTASASTTVQVRLLRSDDRARVEAMTRATGAFRGGEIGVALEVFDAATGRSGQVDPDYETAGAVVGGELAGWACWGPTPGTLGTFDLYWIVVDPVRHGQGLGGRLLGEMERRIAGRARLVLIETSGRGDYGSARSFYERHGYRVVATIPHFYAPGDDRVTYAKSFEPR